MNKEIETKDYMDLINMIKKTLNAHNQTLTDNKKQILKILFNNNEHLSVEDIVELSNNHNNSILKVSTVYRTLSTFEAFNIVDTLIIDDKKRYELSYIKKPHYHMYCYLCNCIKEFESDMIHNSFLEKLGDSSFKPTQFNVIINGICKICQK